MTHNPFVPYLNRYTTASPDHQAAFDEFIGQTPPPGGKPLRLETRTEAFVRDCFKRPPPVILTGNAGDGKTCLCHQGITTSLKTNLPARIAFRLPWYHDSMIILDQPGAENLLGRGDMLFLSGGNVERLQGFYVSPDELAGYLLSSHGGNDA